MSWHDYRILKVAALCASFCLHSILIGIALGGLLAFDAAVLQFSMDVVALLAVISFSVFKCIRRNAAQNRTLNLIVFSILTLFSFIGAVGLAARGASRDGMGLCVGLADVHPERCVEAAVAATFLAWIAVVVSGGGLAVSWLDRNSRMGSSNGSSFKQLQLVKTGPSSYCGPTGPYNPRKPARKAPQRVASNKEPATQLPALPFKEFLLEFPEADSGAGPGPGHRQGTLSSGPDPRKERGLPSTRRPPKGPQTEKTKWRESVWARLAT